MADTKRKNQIVSYVTNENEDEAEEDRHQEHQTDCTHLRVCMV
jgi:hypothetical protein